MTFNVFQSPEQGAGFALSVIFLPISIFATGLRFMATRRFNRKIGWDDWHALIALVLFLAYLGYTLWLFPLFNGRSVPVFAEAEGPLKLQTVLKVGNIMNAIYGIQQSFAKFSLLALYHRLFWVNHNFAISVWVVAIAQAGWGIAVFLVHIFACRPIAKVWDSTLEGYCINTNLFFSIYEPINSFLDFLVAGLAIWMLPSLQTKKVTQWHLAFLFAIGGFSGIIGIIKTVEAQNAATSNFESIIWNIVQMATSIICCCAPIYQSILPKTGVYSRMQSWASTTFGSGSRRSQGLSSARKGSTTNVSTGIHQSKTSTLNQRNHWVALDGSSERGLAWAEAETDYQKDGGLHDDDKNDIPMGRVRVQRSVDVV